MVPHRRSLCLCMAVSFYWMAGQATLAATEAFDCLIEPNEVVNLGSVVDGIVETIHVERGDFVKAGQIVATLDSRMQEMAVRIAQTRANSDAAIRTNRARLEFGERRLARTRELYENEIGSLNELDEAETAKLLAELALVESLENQRIAQLEYEQAKVELLLRTIRSPIQGVIVERYVSPGELVARSPLIKIAQLDPLRIEAFLPIRVWRKLIVGMPVKVRPQDPIGGEYVATVTVVDPVIDSASGTVGVRMELPNPENRLPAGLKCTMSLPEQ